MWNDNQRTLTIDERKGSFPGMHKERKFRIAKVSESKGNGIKILEKYDDVADYNGEKVVVTL